MQSNDMCTGRYIMDNGSKRSGVGGTRGGGKVRIILLRSREQQTRVWLES